MAKLNHLCLIAGMFFIIMGITVFAHAAYNADTSDYMGYGVVNNWMNIDSAELAQDLSDHGLTITNVEFLGWSELHYYLDPSQLYEPFETFIGNMRANRIMTSVNLINWNHGEDGGICDSRYSDEWFQGMLDFFVNDIGTEGIILQAASEWGGSCGDKAERWNSWMDEQWTGLKSWNYGARPWDAPSADWYLEYHPSSTGEAFPAGAIVLTDTGNIVQELSSDGSYWGFADPDTLADYAAAVHESGSGFIYYGYGHSDIDHGAIEALGNLAQQYGISADYYEGTTGAGRHASASFAADPCAYDLMPVIDHVADKTMRYGGEPFEMDLWSYVDDYDNTLSELSIGVTSSSGVVICSLDNERYLYCDANGSEGVSTVTISATDPCGRSASESFNVTTYNTAPHIAVPDQTKSCSSNLDNFLDLSAYAWDESMETMYYDVVSQTNTGLLGCDVENGHMLSCDVNACSESYSDIGVIVGDELGYYYVDTFRITLKNFTPSWTSSITGQCINASKAKLVDLRNYAWDMEDKNALAYTLVSQSNKVAANCFIQDTNYISCDGVSNLNSSNTLTIRAADSKGLYADTTMKISTNCFTDKNGVASNIVFQASTKGACMETHSSNTTQLTLTNNSQERKCFRFYVDTTPTELDVSLSNDSLCLNKGETSYFALNANGNGASAGTYTARVFDPDSNIQLYFNYEIGSCSAYDGFRIDETDMTVCQGQKRDFTVIVTNTSGDAKTIALSADNSLTLPYFDRESVDLLAGANRAMEVTVNAKFAPLGKQRITLSGRADNYAIEKKLDIEVVDCSNIKDRTFLIEAPEMCFNVSRGQQFENSFTVKALTAGSTSCGLYSRTIGLQLYGIAGELSHYSLAMVCGEEKSVGFTVMVPVDARAGKKYFTIVGADNSGDGYVEEKQICLNVAGESNAGITVRTETKDISWCGSEIFELELTNTGDFDENFNLSAAEMPVGVKVSFSESFIIVPKGGSKIVYVAIATTPDAKIGDNQSVKVNISGRISLSATIYFNIKEAPSFDDLEIVSASKEITMKAGTEAQYSIILRNNSEKDFKNVKVSFENAPMDVNMEELSIDELLSGQTIALSGKISAGKDVNGAFSPVFVVTSGMTVNKKQLSLTVEGVQGQGFFSGMFGLFGLGGDLIAGAALAIFLIVVIALIVIGLAAAGKPAGKEAWAN